MCLLQTMPTGRKRQTAGHKARSNDERNGVSTQRMRGTHITWFNHNVWLSANHTTSQRTSHSISTKISPAVFLRVQIYKTLLQPVLHM